MKKTRSISFQTIVRVFLQSLAVLTLLVAIGWLVVEPGFEPVLAILGSIAVFVSPLFLKLEEKDNSGSLSFIDECEVGAEIQLSALDVGSAEMGSGGVANFLYDYQVYFGGRHEEMEELDAWLAQTNRPFGLLVAPAGMGKSALVANWSERLRDSGEAIVVYHPISLRYGTNSLKQTLHSLLEQMSEAARKEAALGPDCPYVSGLELIDESFSKEELQELCFHLSVDYDNLGEGGKRSKAQELIRRYQRNRRLDELVDLCRRMRPQHDWDAAFARSTPDRLLYEPPQEGNNEQLLIDQLQKNLRQSTGWDKPLVVVVDGLDELANQLNQPRIKPVGFLPNQVGEGIYLLAVARGESNDVRDDWERALGWERSPVHPFTLGALQKKDIREMVSRSRSGIESEFLDPLADKIYALSEEGDPLIASLWLDWLAKRANQELSSFLEDLGGQSPGINTYIDGVLSQINPLVSEGAKPLFEVLSLARGPLTAGDLYALGIKIDSGQLDRLVNLSGRLIIKTEKAYVISHSRIRQTVQDKFVSPEGRESWLEQFHRYGRCGLKQAKNAVDGKIPPVSPYLLNYYAEHLQEDKPSGYEVSLYALVDEAWMEARYAASSSYEGFLADVQRAWRTAEKAGYEEVQSDQQISTMGIQVQCALAASSIATLLGNLPPALPAMLVRDRRWAPNMAIQYASLVPDTLQRIRTRLALLELFSQKDEFEQHIGPTVSRTLDDLGKFTDQNDEELRARLLLIVFPFLTEPYHINDAVEQARSLRSIAWRVRLWGNLVKRLPSQEDQIALLAETLRTCAKVRFSSSLGSEPHEASEEMEPYVLGAIAANLPPGILDRSLQIAFDVSGLDESSREGNSILEGRIQLLRMLAPHIPECISEEFLQTCLETKQMDSSMGDSISVTIIHLAPRLSQSGIITAYKHLADKVERYKEGDNFGLGSGIRALTQSYFVAMIVLAHFSLDTEIKKKIGKLLEEKFVPLQPSPDHGLWGIGAKRHHTILALYKTVFMGETDEEIARQITAGEIEIKKEKDYPLFCLLGPKSMKAIIEQLYAKGEITNLWAGRGIRSSPYYLAAVATQLPDENLDWIMKIAGGNDLDYEDYRRGEHFDMEEWGRLRAIATVADRLSPAHCQDYARFVIERRLFSFDSSLEAVKSLADNLSTKLVESLLQGYDWRKWLLLEQINALLNPEVRAVVRQKLYTDLQKTTYHIMMAQSLVVLSADLGAKQSEPISKLVLDKASFIADLPTRMETVNVYFSRATNKSRHWRHVLNRQVRKEALALTTSTYPTHILSHLSFRYRVKVLYRFRREAAHILGMSLSRRDILKLAIIESNQLRQTMQFLLLVFAVLVSKLSKKPKHRFSIAHWFNSILERFEYSEWLFSLQGWIGDVSVTNKTTRWVVAKWLSENGSDQEVDDVDETNRYKTFLDFVLPDIENIDDKSAVEQRETWANFYSALRSLGHKNRDQMDLGRYRQIMRQYGPEIWCNFPRELYEAALQAVMTDDDRDGEHRNNLLALLPGIAAYCPDMLPNWREQISHFWRPTNKAILLTAVGNYLPQKGQRDVIEEAFIISMKDHDRNDADWSCGLILQEVAQYAEDSLLPFVAQCFVKYHKRDSLSEPWRDAIMLMAQRIGTRMELIEILWPLIQKMENYSLAAFIKTVAPNLDRENVIKLLILTSEMDTQNDWRLADAYVSLRTRWRELAKDDGFVIWCDFLHEISVLTRADFLRRIGWFSGVVEDLGGQVAVEQVGDSILEVSQWQWHSSRS